MRDEKVKEVPINIESVLSFVKDQLSRAEDSIRYAQLELAALTQTIQNHFMQKDMHVCKCTEKLLPGLMCMCGEKPSKGYQLTQDRVKIAEDFWKSFKSEE